MYLLLLLLHSISPLFALLTMRSASLLFPDRCTSMDYMFSAILLQVSSSFGIPSSSSACCIIISSMLSVPLWLVEGLWRHSMMLVNPLSQHTYFRPFFILYLQSLKPVLLFVNFSSSLIDLYSVIGLSGLSVCPLASPYSWSACSSILASSLLTLVTTFASKDQKAAVAADYLNTSCSIELISCCIVILSVSDLVTCTSVDRILANAYDLLPNPLFYWFHLGSGYRH